MSGIVIKDCFTKWLILNKVEYTYLPSGEEAMPFGTTSSVRTVCPLVPS